MIKKLFNLFLKRKFLISLIIILVITSIVLFFKYQNYKYILLYEYQTIPDIELKNTLSQLGVGVSGEAVGFVKFDNVQQQPKGLRQYYIIEPLNKFDDNSRQYFSLEEFIKMPYLSIRSTGMSELVETSETSNSITLEDENGNRFFIDKTSKEVSMRDSTGDSTILLTNDSDFKNFIEKQLR